MARKAFNWSLLDRDMLYSMLHNLKPEIVDKRLTIGQFTSLVSKHIKTLLPVKVTTSRFAPVRKGEIWIGGVYHSYLDNAGNKRFIEIQLACPPDALTMKTSEYRWSRICTVFADTVLHEIIHTRQYRARNFKDIPGYESTAYYARDRREQEYYGHKDEMGAFSFNIACELYEKFGNDFDAAKHYLDSNLCKRAKKTCWYKYMKTFGWNHTHPVIRSMKKKIIRNLPYAQIGKPFKTPDHLTY